MCVIWFFEQNNKTAFVKKYESTLILLIVLFIQQRLNRLSFYEI